MLMTTDGVPAFESDDAAWRAHDLAQLRYFRSLSRREKLAAIEGMADVVRQLERARASSSRDSGDEFRRA
jgi:hypothetical protein